MWYGVWSGWEDLDDKRWIVLVPKVEGREMEEWRNSSETRVGKEV